MRIFKIATGIYVGWPVPTMLFSACDFLQLAIVCCCAFIVLGLCSMMLFYAFDIGNRHWRDRVHYNTILDTNSAMVVAGNMGD